jgi:hypothetical protein
MNAEDFRARAEQAVASIDPDAGGYDRIRTTIARRRRGTRGLLVAAAVGVVIGIVVLVLPRNPHARVAPPAGSPTPASTPTASVPPHVAADDADLDGDGKDDTAALVFEYNRSDPRWRYGIKATMSTLGTQTLWRPRGFNHDKVQSLIGLADLDGDGDGEVVMSPGGWARGVFYDIATVVDGKLTWAEQRAQDAVLSTSYGTAAGRDSWRCADDVDRGRYLITTHVEESADGRTLVGRRTLGRLVGSGWGVVDRETASWNRGDTPPAAYGDAGINCGSLRAPTP